MKLFAQKKSEGFVTINILHRRPDYPRGVEFMNTYCVVNNPKLDLKRTMHKAFKKAHPNWEILKVDLRKVK